MSRRVVLMALLMGVIAFPARGQTSRGDGSQTGDGSTPFTGLAQAPEANMFVGAATTSVPIQVPPGRKNLTPKLTLTYSSNGGPSPYGYGWDLSLPRIQRATKKGARTCGGDHKEFVLTLPSGTIECSMLSTGHCSPHPEEVFVKIAATISGNQLTWNVWDKSGIHYTFGGVSASTNNGSTFSAAASTGDDVYSTDPTACGFGATWALTAIDDPNGNTLSVKYLLDQDVLYPFSIQYGGNGAFNHPFEIAFEWDPNPRDDQLLNGTGGDAAVLSKRLSRIDVRYAGQQVRAYSLGYTLAANRVGRQTFLESVTLLGSDDTVLSRADNMPAASTFIYHAKTPGFADDANAQLPSRPGLITNPGYFRWNDTSGTLHTTWRDVFDVNGDGFPDLVDASGDCSGRQGWNVYLGSKAGFAPTAIVWYLPLALIGTPFSCAIRSSVDASPTHTSWATFDLNGDGLPDFVDARNAANGTTWNVYLGTAHSAGGSWGFATTATLWSVPAQTQYTQKSKHATIFNPFSNDNWTGQAVYQDLLDMTGDGRPDLVIAPGSDDTGSNSNDDPLDPAPWTVYPNTGSGFGTGYTFQGAFHSISFQTDNGTTYNGLVYGTFDVNGDGLPDGVLSQRVRGTAQYTGNWQVSLNTGAGMQPRELWPVPQGTSPMWRWIRATSNNQPDAILRDFIDINGDGLPDLVDRTGWSSAQPYWRVYLNRGDSIEQSALLWPAPMDRLRDGGPNAQFTDQDTFDIDGDGLVDFLDFSGTGQTVAIHHALDGAWEADPANAALVTETAAGMRPDLLVTSENGIGSTTYLAYRPSTQWNTALPFNVWVVSDISTDDGLCVSGGSCVNPSSAHAVGMKYTYFNGFYDTVGRAFRGFGLVVSEETTLSAATPHRGTLTIFNQTPNFSGKVFSTSTYDASNGQSFIDAPISASQNTWECANVSTGATITCPATASTTAWVRLRKVVDTTYSNFTFANAQQTATTNSGWGQCGGKLYGNVADVTKGALSGAPLLRTHTDYACSDGGATGGPYIVDRPTHVLVTDTSGSGELEEKWFFYDAAGYGQLTAGNVTKTESWLNQSLGQSPLNCSRTPTAGSGGCVSTQTGYDGYGNITSVTDALGRITSTAYDNGTHIYPAAVTQPPVAGQTYGYRVSRTYDPGCGTLVTESIPYRASGSDGGNKSTHHYDVFCRRDKTWRPGEDTGGKGYREYSYRLGAPGYPTVVSTMSRETFHVGGQTTMTALTDALGRAIQQKSESEVDGAPAELATATQYDELGHVIQQSVPFVWNCGGSGCFLTYTDPVAGTGKTSFEYDAVGRATTQTNPDNTQRTMNHNVAWQTVTLDECSQGGQACEGTKTTETVDPLGRVIERKQEADNGGILAHTHFSYDELGKLTATTQEGGTGLNTHTTVTTTYDTLGRKITVHDPDASISADWQFGYDRDGNVVFQNDPKGGQHLEFCYDELNRVTKKFALTGDAYAATNCNTAATVSYTYNESTLFGLGRLASVDDEAGSMTVLAYDVLGRVLHDQRTIDVNGDVTSAEMRYAYDAADHLITLTYPDSEAVTYSYDGVGRVNSLTGRETYLVNLTYDPFGRPRKVIHPNAVEDERTYGGASTSYRLSQIQTTLGSTNPTVLYRYAYTSYDADGRLAQLSDMTSYASALSNSATFSYDGLGRLQQTQDNLGTHTDRQDDLDNLTKKDGISFTYPVDKPHQPDTYNGQALFYDDNGSRNVNVNSSQTYDYDKENHLVGINTGPVTFTYDYVGRRAIMITPAGTIRYYNNLFEGTSAGTVTKYYTAGPLLIAQRDETNAAFASAELGSAVRIAGRSILEPAAVVLILRRDVQIVLAATILFGSAALIMLPPRRRRRRTVGIAVRPGSALGTAVLVVVVTMPWPILVFPTPAFGACGSTPIAVHYHFDHLGSTHLITDPTGNVIEYVRYTPYGHPRRLDGSGQSKAADPRYRREFTGYETELYSSIQYAGARFYDPNLGMFQSHDPAHEFANPYSYTGWDPVNRTDPNGACLWDSCIGEIALIVGIASSIGFTTSYAQARMNGASGGQALEAGAIGGAIAGAAAAVSAVVLQPLLTAILTPIVAQVSSSASAQVVANFVLIGAGVGQSAYSLSQGDLANGLIGLAAAGVGLYLALSGGANGAYSGSGGGGSTGGFRGRVLFPEEIDELDALYYGRTPPDWYQVVVDNEAGIGGRAYTWGNTVHLGSDFSTSPLGAGTEDFALLAHEAAHVVDFAQSFAGTLVGAVSDQAKYTFGVDVYNPRITGAPLSSYSVEGRATLYEWAYRLYYPTISYGPSNFPLTAASRVQLYNTLYP